MSLRAELMELPLDRIVPHPNGRPPDGDLIASVARFDLLRPLHVRAQGEGRYTLIEGSRRLGAARQLGKATVAAIVELAESAGPSGDLQMLVLNRHRENLGQLCVARRAQRLLEENPDLRQAGLARQLQMHKSTLCHMLAVLACPALVQAVERDGLEFSSAKALAALNPSEQAALLAELRAIERETGKFPPSRQVEAMARERQGQAPLAVMRPEQLAAVVRALQDRGVPVEIRTVCGKSRGIKATLALTEAENEWLRGWLEEAEEGQTAGSGG